MRQSADIYVYETTVYLRIKSATNVNGLQMRLLMMSLRARVSRKMLVTVHMPRCDTMMQHTAMLPPTASRMMRVYIITMMMVTYSSLWPPELTNVLLLPLVRSRRVSVVVVISMVRSDLRVSLKVSEDSFVLYAQTGLLVLKVV